MNQQTNRCPECGRTDECCLDKIFWWLGTPTTTDVENALIFGVVTTLALWASIIGIFLFLGSVS